jgi:hypothetical protein
MVTPSHITRGIALINLGNQANKLPPKILAEDGNIYLIHSPKESEINKYRTTNKFLANHFLKIWNLRSPKLAAIHAPPSIFKGISKTNLLPKSSITSGKVCFGIQSHRAEIMFNPLMDDVHYWSYKAFNNPLDFLKLALFDGWIGNNGRKNPSKDLFFLSNRNHKLELYTSHHEFTFGNIPYEYLSKNYRNKAHFSILELNIVRKIISMNAYDELKTILSAYYFDAIKKVIHSFADILEEMPENYRIRTQNKNKIKEFIENKDKNERVLEEFLDIIKP